MKRKNGSYFMIRETNWIRHITEKDSGTITKEKETSGWRILGWNAEMLKITGNGYPDRDGETRWVRK